MVYHKPPPDFGDRHVKKDAADAMACRPPAGDDCGFGIGAGRQAGNGHLRRNATAPGGLGWDVTEKWIGGIPGFADAGVHCDGTALDHAPQN